MVFFSYRTNTETKQESPADDQFWKFSRQYSILVTLATSGHNFKPCYTYLCINYA